MFYDFDSATEMTDEILSLAKECFHPTLTKDDCTTEELAQSVGDAWGEKETFDETETKLLTALKMLP